MSHLFWCDGNRAETGFEFAIRRQRIGNVLAGVFKDLKSWGLDGSKVTLGIMDGLPGMETVFKEKFPQAKTQCCQVHVARNVLARCQRSSSRKWRMIYDLSSYVSSREEV